MAFLVVTFLLFDLDKFLFCLFVVDEDVLLDHGVQCIRRKATH